MCSAKTCRCRWQLAELRTAELRFTAEEAVEPLHGAAGPGLPDAALAMLAARTEGWAARLQLAGLSLRGQADVESFVATFSGSHRYVLDYLAGEVLERQAEQVRTFLLETSVLERLSGALCDSWTTSSALEMLLSIRYAVANETGRTLSSSRPRSVMPLRTPAASSHAWAASPGRAWPSRSRRRGSRS